MKYDSERILNLAEDYLCLWIQPLVNNLDQVLTTLAVLFIYQPKTYSYSHC